VNPAGRRHLPFVFGFVLGVATTALSAFFAPKLAIVAGANTFFVTYLMLTAIKIPRLTADFLRRNAAGADEPAWVVLAVTLCAVVVALASLFLLINDRAPAKGVEFALSLASVPLGWITIHTMAALHYAHRYWRPEGDGAGQRQPHGGLDFPGRNDPSAYDFLYYAFVIGMTAQTSDIAVASTAMRKLTLLHSVASFFFNTVLVAAAVNLAVSLGQ